MTWKWIVKITQAINFLLILGWQLTSGAQTTPIKEGICAIQLGEAIDAIVSRHQFRRERWGILVETLSRSERPLYSRESERYFTPASVTKLLTTAAALQKLGSSFRIRTSVYSFPNREELRVVGRGDPTLTDAQLIALAKQLRSKGITRVKKLIAEDSYFRGNQVNPNWEWEDIQAGYGTAVNSLILNQNSIDLILSPRAVGQPLDVTWVNPKEAANWQIENNSQTVSADAEEFVKVGRDFAKPIIRISGQLRVDSQSEPVYVAVIAPAERFLQGFREALAAEGISVEQASVSMSSINNLGEMELAAVESPPLSELVKQTNQESNNLFAEVLLRLLAADKAEADTAAAGLNVLKYTLRQLGVTPDSYILADGSGLSRHNLISPEALVQTLRGMASTPVGEIYRASLPAPRRFGAGIVQAKTGSMTGVSTLSGYVNPPDYQPLVFSIMLNHSSQPASAQRQAIDEIVLLLTRLRRC
ncbi:MAG: D-alanyl-D-alanine carboxypeptidase/D-alanyl-D-alanine-endopeptidase [Oscillatoriaceae bacterium SKW80]|nr:D-alanyl-D-alanine carboxypeptidase/D-alanyl-D-alanine-endopeptidase [Oscillatoriaceae bacterium SKYG93]MCX8119386.1 D-alanyl-D-alanine carboxypeptidase/D-alanyl-D-alanine-endopeptidase [Oscillatoriaceae bacterium SKW80]MDW8454853.1 D-alanyl-D-alanine carboxypeptidase/D-alanyl-D-alanine-endopeptidase [Oscillatoriaceae cyanobacterium SKYGB_i_bin93]HIK28368.1 D-alanyl-D-alanine carboxypeptidase/D-alanyl-D-alanine-endopeptidase [Oscillatoriaceae cyanobacterium M7585_C2015_266]